MSEHQAEPGDGSPTTEQEQRSGSGRGTPGAPGDGKQPAEADWLSGEDEPDPEA